jgi:hypothetical protein
MDSANVIVGYGYLYTAPKGTALPSLATQPTPSTWATAGFTEAGYTDDGVTITYTPTFKSIEVDESMSPVDIRLVGEKLEVSVKLAEATLLNLVASIAGATLTETSTTSTLTLGNPANPDQGEIVLAFQGPAPQSIPGTNTLGRVFVMFRAKASAAVSYHAQRKDKVVYNVKWEAMALSSAAAGAQLAEIIDYTGTGS